MSHEKNKLISKEIEQQRKYYAENAASFDNEHPDGRANRCHYAKIIRIHLWLNLDQGQHVLEVGTGTGIHASWLLRLCKINYVGVDISPEMLAIARKRLGDSAKLLVSPAEELPFDSASFDGILCSGALHHIADKNKAINEIARVLKQGCRFVLSEPNPWNPNNIRAWMTKPLERGQCEMRLKKFQNWFNKAGLDIIHFEYFNFTPPKPKIFESLFGVIDKVCAEISGLRKIGSMQLIVGKKK